MKSKHDELNLREMWFQEAKGMTLERLPDFLKRLSEFPHDYGTIPRAVAAAGLAAMNAMDKSKAGGITGFQAGFLIWDVISEWGTFGEGPKRMLMYRNMLYPQYRESFHKTISKDVWEYLQEEANQLLKNPTAVPEVVEHWRSIVAGEIPFGYRIGEN